VVASTPPPAAPGGALRNVPAPLAGNIFKVDVTAGQTVKSGDVIMILEAMKMETEVRSPESGTAQAVLVKEGDAVQVGDILLTMS
jgi:oxaloacetate decarboxylase alpha subunit